MIRPRIKGVGFRRLWFETNEAESSGPKVFKDIFKKTRTQRRFDEINNQKKHIFQTIPTDKNLGYYGMTEYGDKILLGI